jgi:cyclophilin family peptidyl-prolyl cis-trans isomerase
MNRYLVALSIAVLTTRSGAQQPTAAQKRAALRNPSSAFWKTKAPDTVTADMETSRGPVTIQLIREWAPHGVDRFYNLARAGYFDDSRFYRVIIGFVAQFGVAGNPTIATLWASQKIPADSVREHNVRGAISFAQYKPTDRNTNLFVNLSDNPKLDTLGFAPIGRVTSGMEVLDSLYFMYGDVASSPPPLGDPARLYRESNKYLDAKYPKMDRLIKITVRPPTGEPPHDRLQQPPIGSSSRR